MRTDPVHQADVFHCVCVGGIQVGQSANDRAEAQAAIDALAADGVPLGDITVDSYAQGPGDEAPVEAGPWFRDGRWHEAMAA